MKLKKDIHNLMNRSKLYAHAGDEVKLIGTVIVMALDGSKFSVRAEDLEESVREKPSDSTPDTPEKAKEVKKPLFTEPPKDSRKVKKSINPPTLF